MKKYKITEEFIKEAHKSACSEWKAKIEKEFPDAFKNQLEVGKWYKETTVFKNNMLVHVLKNNENGDIECFGFNGRGVWFDNKDNFGTNGLELATPKEVEDALIKEAVKRGFKDSFDYISLAGFSYHISKVVGFYFERNTLVMNHSNGINDIFNNGTWATIIERPKEVLITMEEIAKLKGCKVEQIKIMK